MSSPGRLIAIPSAIVAAPAAAVGRPASSDATNGEQARACTPTISISGRAAFSAPADPAEQAAAADRDDHLGEVRHLLEQLEAERRLPEDHVRVVEGVHERRAGLLRALARERATQSSTDSPPRCTVPPKPSTAATLATAASSGM